MPTGAIFISQPVSAAPDHLHPGEKEPCRNSRSLRPDWADEAAFFHVLISLAYRHRHLSLTHKAADHRIIPNGNTRHHDHASTQPAVASNADGQIVLVCFLPQFRQDRVVCGCKDTVRTYHGVLPDVDMGIIHAGQPEVGIDIMPMWTCFPPQLAWNGGSIQQPAPHSASISFKSCARFACSEGRVWL